LLDSLRSPYIGADRLYRGYPAHQLTLALYLLQLQPQPGWKQLNRNFETQPGRMKAGKRPPKLEPMFQLIFFASSFTPVIIEDL
jgi:hypothetical protein